MRLISLAFYCFSFEAKAEHEVPADIRALFGISASAAAQMTGSQDQSTGPVQEWDELGPEDQEAVREGMLTNVEGVPADVTAMMQKAVDKREGRETHDSVQRHRTKHARDDDDDDSDDDDDDKDDDDNDDDDDTDSQGDDDKDVKDHKQKRHVKKHAPKKKIESDADDHADADEDTSDDESEKGASTKEHEKGEPDVRKKPIQPVTLKQGALKQVTQNAKHAKHRNVVLKELPRNIDKIRPVVQTLKLMRSKQAVKLGSLREKVVARNQTNNATSQVATQQSAERQALRKRLLAARGPLALAGADAGVLNMLDEQIASVPEIKVRYAGETASAHNSSVLGGKFTLKARKGTGPPARVNASNETSLHKNGSQDVNLHSMDNDDDDQNSSDTDEDNADQDAESEGSSPTTSEPNNTSLLDDGSILAALVAAKAPVTTPSPDSSEADDASTEKADTETDGDDDQTNEDGTTKELDPMQKWDRMKKSKSFKQMKHMTNDDLEAFRKKIISDHSIVMDAKP